MFSSISTSNWWVHAVSQPPANETLAPHPVRHLGRLMLVPLSRALAEALARRRRLQEGRRMEAEFDRLAETSAHLLADIGIDTITYKLPEDPVPDARPPVATVWIGIRELLAPSYLKLGRGRPA